MESRALSARGASAIVIDTNLGFLYGHPHTDEHERAVVELESRTNRVALSIWRAPS